MWEIFDRLIEGIPSDWVAEEVVRGSSYSFVRSHGSIGIAEHRVYDYRMPVFNRNMEGLPLIEIAGCIKSWNFYEASIGLAAINAYYNHIETARAAGVPIQDSLHVEDRIYDPFIMAQNEVRGKKVTVIGHFPYISTLLQPICEISIVTGEIPQEGDFPLSATDYLLPESDYVFIGSSSLIDKTLPRYLKLSAKAVKRVLVGPSTTLAPALFDFGVDDLSGFVVKDVDRAVRLVKGAENGKIFSTGQKVAFKKKL